LRGVGREEVLFVRGLVSGDVGPKISLVKRR